MSMNEFDAVDFDRTMVRGMFAPVYPALAGIILERTGITEGRCLDIGSGPGMLGIRLAERSRLEVVLCDPDPECVRLANIHIQEHDMTGRVRAVGGCAESIPLPSASVDLVVSRGSIYFWDDAPAGLKEVFRVLSPGGQAFIGGGMGSARLATQVAAERAREKRTREPACRRYHPDKFSALLSDAGIPGDVVSDESGTWIVFRKPSNDI